MNPKLLFILGALTFSVAAAGIGNCQPGMVLNVCQELLNNARMYEARASNHNRAAKVIQTQIESMAKLPKNDGTIQAIDNLFAQYDQNRSLESKYRELYKQATEEANRCMKSAE